MFAPHQIFTDNLENISSSSKGSVTHKGLGLNFKDSTNIKQPERKLSEPGLKEKEFKPILKENVKEKSSGKSSSKKPLIEESPEEWSDIEEMHIYNEPDDDYEDILPKSQRIKESEIDFLFMTFPFTTLTELSADLLPTAPEEMLVSEPEDVLLSPPDIEDELYDSTPIQWIPYPDNPSL